MSVTVSVVMYGYEIGSFDSEINERCHCDRVYMERELKMRSSQRNRTEPNIISLSKPYKEGNLKFNL
jgi:hypothetical protein